MPQSRVPLCTADSDDPIDWAHRDRVTLGDRELATEVLQLFVGQAGAIAGAIRDATPDTAGALAHKLKGSARGIGAWPVANAAEHLEAILIAKADAGPAVDALLKRIAVACDAIERHLHNA